MIYTIKERTDASDAGEEALAGQGNVEARAGGTASPELDRPIVRALGVHNDGRGVTVPSLIETTCEL